MKNANIFVDVDLTLVDANQNLLSGAPEALARLKGKGCHLFLWSTNGADYAKKIADLLVLIVLRSSEMEASLAFYRALGFAFVEEQHGTGPIHYSTHIGSSVMEIFPGEPAAPLGRKASGATMLGFSVTSVDQAVAAVKNLGNQIVTAPSDSPWGRRAVVVDPDGRSIELSESRKN